MQSAGMQRAHACGTRLFVGLRWEGVEVSVSGLEVVEIRVAGMQRAHTCGTRLFAGLQTIWGGYGLGSLDAKRRHPPRRTYLRHPAYERISPIFRAL